MIPCTQQQSTQTAARAAGITAPDLWLHYYSLGGNLDAFHLDAYLHGAHPLSVDERNIVAVALNELIDDVPPYPRADIDYSPETG